MSQALLDYVLAGEHHKYRRDSLGIDNLAEYYRDAGFTPEERMADRFERLCRAEIPHILPDEKICYVRTIKNIPDCFTPDEWEEIRKKNFIHESGYISNLSPDYAKAISRGLVALREEADEFGRRAIDNIIDLADRYRDEAKRVGRDDIAVTLERVPRYGATNLREALQFFRIIHFSLWLEGNYHVTTGRFDKYIYPYFKADMDKGLYTHETALELIEDFFISFNKDSDLYLGGRDENGREWFSELSELCLEASRNLKLIDPKINLRVSKSTPIEQYIKGTELTRAGLGFPQYSNDDVVIDGLVSLGYSPEDAANYVVAACWEFIIPGCAFDVVNIGALSFPKVIDTVLHKSFTACNDFDALMSAVRAEINAECDRITSNIHDLWFVPSPFMSVMLDDIKYRNFGIHGTGIATAADSLAAIRRYVYDEKSITPAELIAAVDNDFADTPELLHRLRFEAPKMGRDDDYVDGIATSLEDMFADSLAGRGNCEGGIFRAGTGSAMYYLWHAAEIGASPDGRRRGEPFGTNFSPSLFADTDGPVSVIKSFTKQNLGRVINGGPLTLEFHNSVFRGDDSLEKVAAVVKYFIDRGGHQLQLNSVNLETMKDAKLHPDKHRRLVVRIWGWSAYFVELDPEYQDHVIARQEYSI